MLTWGEAYVQKNCMIEHHGELLPRLGFTDVSILECSRKDGMAVLTDDFQLAGTLQELDYPVINFNYVRQDLWGL